MPFTTPRQRSSCKFILVRESLRMFVLCDHVFKESVYCFFLKKNPEIEIEKQKKWQRWIFKKNIVCPKMGPKMERFFLVFTKFFHHFLQDERPCISLFPCISYFSIFCFTNHRPKCSHPVRLQDSLTINISERNP